MLLDHNNQLSELGGGLERRLRLPQQSAGQRVSCVVLIHLQPVGPAEEFDLELQQPRARVFFLLDLELQFLLLLLQVIVGLDALDAAVHIPHLDYGLAVILFVDVGVDHGNSLGRLACAALLQPGLPGARIGKSPARDRLRAVLVKGEIGACRLILLFLVLQLNFEDRFLELPLRAPRILDTELGGSQLQPRWRLALVSVFAGHPVHALRRLIFLRLEALVVKLKRALFVGPEGALALGLSLVRFRKSAGRLRLDVLLLQVLVVIHVLVQEGHDLILDVFLGFFGFYERG